MVLILVFCETRPRFAQATPMGTNNFVGSISNCSDPPKTHTNRPVWWFVGPWIMRHAPGQGRGCMMVMLFCEQHSMMGSAACYAHSIALAVRQFASKNIEVLQNTSKHYVCTKKCRVDSDIVWAFFSSRPPLKNVLHLSTWNWCHSFMKIFIPRPQTQWPCSFWDVNRRTWANWTCTLEIFPLPSPHSVRP